MDGFQARYNSLSRFSWCDVNEGKQSELPSLFEITGSFRGAGRSPILEQVPAHIEEDVTEQQAQYHL